MISYFFLHSFLELFFFSPLHKREISPLSTIIFFPRSKRSFLDLTLITIH